MNQREFAERVTAMQGSLYRVAASYLRGESDRLDAVAEAIAKAWEKRQTLRDEALFATWMTRILIRVCVDMRRRQKRMIPTDDVAERTAENEKVTALREAIDSLPQKARTMIVLHYMEGYDVREIAKMMGTTKGAVCAQEDGKTVWTVWHHNAVGICAVAIDAADGTILDMIIDTGMAGNG